MKKLMKKKTIGLLFVVLAVIVIFAVVSAQVWDDPKGKQKFGHTHEWITLLDFPGDCPAGEFVSGVDSSLTCAIPDDNDWTGAGSGQMYTTNLNDRVGIGTSDPQSKLHIDEGISIVNQEVVRITFSNDALNIGTRGIRIVSTPLDRKGTQIGVEAQTSKTGGSQEGSASSRLAQISGYLLRGAFIGVEGRAAPDTLDNFNNGARSKGLGGFFLAEPNDILTLDNTGTYWVGGAYGEVAGAIDHTPASGAVAGIIGVDNANGTAESYAGYFDGRLRVTELPQDNTLNSIVVADTGGVLHTRNANTLVSAGIVVYSCPDKSQINKCDTSCVGQLQTGATCRLRGQDFGTCTNGNWVYYDCTRVGRLVAD